LTTRAVVVVHREPMVAEGLAAALARFREIVPIGVATSAADAEPLGMRADAVAVDASLPGAEELAERLRARGVRVVLIGGDAREDEGLRVPTGSTLSHLASALVPGIREATEAASWRSLTRREREVLHLVSRGLAGKQVARHLGISPKTVERHKTRIFAKLGVPNQTAAATLAMSGGLSGGAP
jgi:DNA-binding NarL/FixJ family response regulator